MNTRMRLLCLVSILTIMFVYPASAQSPHGWRGPDRTGLYYEKELMKTWPEEGPRLLWETMDAGNGYSSPVVADGRLYITGLNQDKDKEMLSAYSLDGKKIYEVAYGAPWDGSYPEIRCTPTIENGKAYIISGAGEVVCLDITNGKTIWKINAGEKYGRKTGKWGAAESPLVFDNKVIYMPAGNQTTMIALNAETGALVWKTKPFGDTGAYVSPILIKWNGTKKIIGATEDHLMGVHPETGNIEWTFDDWKSPDATHNNTINTPLYHDGRIFFSNGYDMGSVMLQLNADASNATFVWRNNDLDTHHGGYVLIDGIIYGSNWSTNNSGNWLGVEWLTGKTRFEDAWKGSKGKGSIITADGMIIAYDERRGTVGLVRPDPDKFDVVSEFRITKGEGPHWAHPVIDNGILYIRHGSALMAYKIK